MSESDCLTQFYDELSKGNYGYTSLQRNESKVIVLYSTKDENKGFNQLRPLYDRLNRLYLEYCPPLKWETLETSNLERILQELKEDELKILNWQDKNKTLMEDQVHMLAIVTN